MTLAVAFRVSLRGSSEWRLCRGTSGRSGAVVGLPRPALQPPTDAALAWQADVLAGGDTVLLVPPEPGRRGLRCRQWSTGLASSREGLREALRRCRRGRCCGHGRRVITMRRDAVTSLSDVVAVGHLARCRGIDGPTFAGLHDDDWLGHVDAPVNGRDEGQLNTDVVLRRGFLFHRQPPQFVHQAHLDKPPSRRAHAVSIRV